MEIWRSEVSEVEQVARELLAQRIGEITDGELDGQWWFAVLIEQARDIVRRRTWWRSRQND